VNTELSVLDGLSSCQVSDALRMVGLPHAGLAGLRPYPGAEPMVGRAFTVAFGDADTSTTVGEYLDQVRPGNVLMLAHRGRTDCSVWGGQRTIGARHYGAVGTVVDGSYRDVGEHRELGFPVYGAAPTVVGSTGVVVPVAVGEPVTMAGITVRPGDAVVADESGVVVVPWDRVAEVAGVAHAVVEQERDIAEAVNNGADFVSYRAAARAAG
jgi:4-hydroxy-4-methyl-2-oxoglutarate aldolase